MHDAYEMASYHNITVMIAVETVLLSTRAETIAISEGCYVYVGMRVACEPRAQTTLINVMGDSCAQGGTMLDGSEPADC